MVSMPDESLYQMITVLAYKKTIIMKCNIIACKIIRVVLRPLSSLLFKVFVSMRILPQQFLSKLIFSTISWQIPCCCSLNAKYECDINKIFMSHCQNLYAFCSRNILGNIDGLVQDCSNSVANALEFLQSCAKPSILCMTSLLSWCRKGLIDVRNNQAN